MNAGIISTVALFFIMQVFDPEGKVSVDAQIILGGIIFAAVTWAKNKIAEFKTFANPRNGGVTCDGE